jgi:hypothetical protein
MIFFHLFLRSLRIILELDAPIWCQYLLKIKLTKTAPIISSGHTIKMITTSKKAAFMMHDLKTIKITAEYAGLNSFKNNRQRRVITAFSQSRAFTDIC